MPASAAGSGTVACEKVSFLGFVPWYNNLTDTDCSIKEINKDNGGLSTLVWTIVGNVLSDLFVAVGYFAVGTIVYSGFLYMTADGNSLKAQKAQKGLTASIIGLIIAVVAAAIVRFIMEALLG